MATPESETVEEKLSFDYHPYASDAISSVGLYYLFENYFRTMIPSGYSELIGVFAIGGLNTMYISDMIKHLIFSTKEEIEADNTKKAEYYKDNSMLYDFLISGSITAIIYTVLRNVLPASSTSTLMRYTVLIASVIGTSIFKEYIMSWFTSEKSEEEK